MRSFARQSGVNPFRRLVAAGAMTVFGLQSGCTRNDEMLLGGAMTVRPSQVLSGRPLGGRGFTIGISLPSSADLNFVRAARQGMAAAAADNEVLLDLRSAESIADNRRQQVRQLIDDRVNALLLWSQDAGGAADAVQAANAAGVPVFTIGVESERSHATAHFVTCTPLIGLSPEQIGRRAVDKVAAYLRGEKLKPVVIIR